MLNKKISLALAVILFLLVGMFAFSLRWAALQGLDSDNDESLYSAHNGTSFSFFMANGEFDKIMNYRVCYEHPPLVRLMYGIGIYLTGVAYSAEKVIFVSRIISSVFSVFHAWLLFFINPIGSILFSINGWQIFYSAKAWLDSISTFFASFAVWALWRAENGKDRDKYIFISAFGLGLAFASKYINFIIVIIALYFLIKRFRGQPKYIFLYAGIVLATFFVFDPALWNNPVKNLWDSLTFHKFYSDSFSPGKRYESFYGKSNMWRQLSFLWNPGQPWQLNFIYFRWEKFIFIAGFLGIIPLYRRSKLLFVWFVTTFLFILAYPIRWPHYNLMFIPVFSISAGIFVREIYIYIFRFAYGKISKEQVSAVAAEERIAIPEKIVLILFLVVMSLIFRSAGRNFNFSPDLSKAYNGHGAALYENKKDELAEKEFMKALEHGPELTAYARINLARIYLAHSELAKAEKELKMASGIDDNIYEIHKMLGDIYTKQAKSAQASEEYNKIGYKPTIISDAEKKYLEMGLKYFNQGNYVKSIESYNKAVEINPSNADAHNNLGVAYLNQNRIDEAECEFRKAVSLNPKSENANRNLGVIYARENRLTEAIDAWRKALKINPNDTQSKAYINRAENMLGKSGMKLR